MAAIIKINDIAYRLPLALEDITLRTHLRIMEAESHAPKRLLELLNEPDPLKRAQSAGLITDKIYVGKIIPYFANVIQAASGIPADVLLGRKNWEGAPVAMIEEWYWRIQQCYLNYKEVKEQQVSEWEVNGSIWALPEKHMTKSTFGQFAEAAQYEESVNSLSAGNREAMPYVMAVLLRPKGEVFDPLTFDEIVEDRKEFMLDLGMDVVMQTAFFLQKLNEKSAPDLAIYTAARELARLKQIMN